MKIMIVMTVLAWSLPTSVQGQFKELRMSLDELEDMEKQHQRNLKGVIKGKQ